MLLKRDARLTGAARDGRVNCLMFNTEILMNDVVLMAGGERVDQSLEANDPQRPKNADYVFRRDNAVAELKSLQQEAFTPAYREKLGRLFRSWNERVLIRVYGRTIVKMQNLPRPCQNEWLRLLTLSLQTNVISKANKQIEWTKDRLGIPDAKGILFLANNGNYSFEPYNLVVLVSQILRKLHPDKTPQYSSIHAVAFFSANLPIRSPLLSTPAFWWFNGHRPSSTDAVSQLLEKLEECWYEQLAKRVGYKIPRVHMPESGLEKLTYLQNVRNV
jgi:hypothetical protein